MQWDGNHYVDNDWLKRCVHLLQQVSFVDRVHPKQFIYDTSIQGTLRRPQNPNNQSVQNISLFFRGCVDSKQNVWGNGPRYPCRILLFAYAGRGVQNGPVGDPAPPTRPPTGLVIVNGYANDNGIWNRSENGNENENGNDNVNENALCA